VELPGPRLVVSGVVLAGNLFHLLFHSKTAFLNQEQIIAMQAEPQGSAIYNMEREIRMAGHDPKRAMQVPAS